MNALSGLDAILTQIEVGHPEMQAIVDQVRAEIANCQGKQSSDSRKVHLDLDSALQLIHDRINAQLKDNRFVVVNIAGGSGAGKSTVVAAGLVSKLEENGIGSGVLSMDDYYHDKVYMQKLWDEGSNVTWGDPDALDMDLLANDISALLKGQAVQKPKYEFVGNSRVGLEWFAPQRVVIVEGLFAFDHRVNPEGSIKVYVDAPLATRLCRRILRNKERDGATPADILKFFWINVYPKFEPIIRPSIECADFVIRNE